MRRLGIKNRILWQISIGTKKRVLGAEICVIAEKIIPSVQIEDNWKNWLPAKGKVCYTGIMESQST